MSDDDTNLLQPSGVPGAKPQACPSGAPASDAALELFFGDANDAEARVYARLPPVASLDGWKITGALTGPICRFAKTLPASIRFRDCGPGSGLLAEAVVPDPCFWTPELPFLYRSTIEARREEELPAQESFTCERWFGIRRLGAIGKSLHLDAERWVARGVRREAPTTADLVAAREAIAVLHVPAVDDEFCLEASRIGVPLFVDLSGDLQRIGAEVRRLGQWPAVFAMVLDPAAPIDGEIRATARNTLFAVRIADRATTELPIWAQLVVADASEGRGFPPVAIDNRPLIASRRLTGAASIGESRAECDRLQFDLAPRGDFAGYIV